LNAAEARSSYYELHFGAEDAILLAAGILAGAFLAMPGWTCLKIRPLLLSAFLNPLPNGNNSDHQNSGCTLPASH